MSMGFWNIDTSSTGALGSNGLPTGVDNDQGTIRAGGTIAASNKFSSDSVSLGQSRVVTIVSGVNGNQAINAAGAFNAGDQVIKRVTTDIAGISNNSQLWGGSNTANRPYSIKKVQSMYNYDYASAIRSGAWHELSGVFTSAVSVQNTGVYFTNDGANATMSQQDDTANPSAAVPGELTFRNGSANPVNLDYAAKTCY